MNELLILLSIHLSFHIKDSFQYPFLLEIKTYLLYDFTLINKSSLLLPMNLAPYYFSLYNYLFLYEIKIRSFKMDI